MFYGFEPVYNKDSEILILGSFPSVKSREQNFYYGHPRNRFWKVLEDNYKVKIENFADKKIDFLLKHKIALWDIISECEIEGSNDSKIKNYKTADLDIILKAADIKKILLNGKKAFKIFTDNFLYDHIKVLCLPSTSPANTAFGADKWKRALM